MRIMRVCALACAMLFGSAALPAEFTVCAESSQTLVYQGMQYEIIDGEITITKATDDLPAEVVIPSEIDGVPVMKIGPEAFQRTSLTRLTVSEGVKRICREAFCECFDLEEVYLPASVREIGLEAFRTGEHTSRRTGSLKTIQVAEDNPYFTSIDGVLYTKNVEKLVQYPNGKVMEGVFEIPESVKTIGAYAIHNANVSVSVPDGLEHIEDYAFWCWDKGYNFQFPPNLKTIGAAAFGNVRLNPENTVLPASIESIGREAFFYSCPSRVTILNPYCFISTDDTFYTGYQDQVKTHNVTLCGYDGSTTEEYAKKWDFAFESLGPIPEELIDWQPEARTADSIEWNNDPDIKWYEYEEYENEVWITGLPGDPDANVRNYKLPDTINGKPVTKISCQDIGYISSLWLPKYLDRIPENDFNKGLVMLKNIFVDPENLNFSDIEGVLFNKDATVLLAFPENHLVMPGEYINCQTAEYTYIVPDTVKELAYASFFGANVQHIQLPEGLEVIEDHAFWCAHTVELNIPKNVRVMDAEVVEGCAAISAVNVSPDNPYFSSEDGILYDKEKTYLILAPTSDEIVDHFVIPDTVTKVHWNAFRRGYRELVIPAGLTDIDGGLTTSGIWASTAEKYTVDENNPVYRSEDGVLFEKNSLMIYPPQKKDLSVYRVPDGTVSLQSSAIRGNDSLRALILCEGLESIGMMCCYELGGLETVYIPDSLESCSISLTSCERLRTVYYGGTEEQLEEINWGLFGDSNLKNVLEKRGTDIVYQADGIPEDIIAEIEAGEKYSGTCGSNLKWTMDLTTDVLTISGDGKMKNYEESYLSAPWRDYRDVIKTVVIEEGVENIGECAFYGCSALTDVTISTSVTSIDSKAFENSGLKSIIIPETVSSIGSYAFAYCKNLSSITILNANCELDDKASTICNDSSYQNGDSIYYYTGIICGDNRSTAQEYAEKYGRNFTALSAPTEGTYESFTYKNYGDHIEITGYEGPDTSLTIPAEIDGAAVTAIGDLAFYHYRNITEVTIPDGVTTIGEAAFEECSLLTNIDLPDSVTAIGDGAFWGCEALTEITIPDGVTSIGSGVFANCLNLTSITIPDGVTSIGESAFENCRGLEELNIPDSVTTIGESAFYWCINLSEITIPDSVKTIGNGAFQYCTGLTEVTIPYSVKSIGSYAFAVCSKLSSITFLNPDCEIYDLKATFSNYEDYNFIGTICGYENSTAQEYAEKYGRNFASLGKADITKGDVNNDGAVDADDASLVLAEYARQQSGHSSEFTESQLTAADFNGDGAVDSDDASLILAYYAAVSTGKDTE